MTQLHVAFEDFGGGERGAIGDFKPVPNTFRASNMLKTIKGEICVRPGLRNISPNGLSNGTVWCFGATDVPGADGFFVQGREVYTFDIGSPSAGVVHCGTMASTPTKQCPYVDNGVIYILNPGDKIYKLDAGAGTLTALSGSPNGSALAIYGSRLCTSDSSPVYRLRFSAENDFTSWPAANFIDVGNNTGITAMFEQNNHLTIFNQQSVWILTGVPGYNDTLRKVARINGPIFQYAAAVGYLDEIVYQGLGMSVPSQFNGARAVNLHSLQYGGGDGASVFPIRALDEGFVLVDGNQSAASLLQSTWTFHTFGVNVSPIGTNQGGIDNIMLITDGGGTSSHPKFYAWDPTAYTPGLESNPGGFMRTGDDSATPISGTLTMPEYWQTIFRGVGNHEFKVKRVTIDFRSFNTGSSTHNNIDLQVKATRIADSTDVTSATQNWNEAAGSSSTSGTQRRITFSPEDLPFGNGFQLLLTNLKGVSIQGFQIILNPMNEIRA